MTKITLDRTQPVPSAQPGDRTEFLKLLRKAAGAEMAVGAGKAVKLSTGAPIISTRGAILLEDLLYHADSHSGLPKAQFAKLLQTADEKADSKGDTAPEIVIFRDEGVDSARFEHTRIDNLIFVREDIFDRWATGLDAQVFPKILETSLTDYAKSGQ